MTASRRQLWNALGVEGCGDAATNRLIVHLDAVIGDTTNTRQRRTGRRLAVPAAVALVAFTADGSGSRSAHPDTPTTPKAPAATKPAAEETISPPAASALAEHGSSEASRTSAPGGWRVAPMLLTLDEEEVFRASSDTLVASAARVLATAASLAAVDLHAELRLTITGSTDTPETRTIARQRVDRLRDALHFLGVSRTRVTFDETTTVDQETSRSVAIIFELVSPTPAPTHRGQ